jgi:Stress responsive A/B Barrel Domain
MFVHSVYFWLKPDLNNEQQARFWQLVHSLSSIESVRHCYIGKPANTERPIIDRSYTCALVTVFDDQAGHDAYQIHPTHEKFRVECSDLWLKVLIYDAITE